MLGLCFCKCHNSRCSTRRSHESRQRRRAFLAFIAVASLVLVPFQAGMSSAAEGAVAEGPISRRNDDHKYREEVRVSCLMA